MKYRLIIFLLFAVSSAFGQNFQGPSTGSTAGEFLRRTLALYKRSSSLSLSLGREVPYFVRDDGYMKVESKRLESVQIEMNGRMVPLETLLPPHIQKRTNTFPTKDTSSNCHQSAYDWHFPNRPEALRRDFIWFNQDGDSGPYKRIGAGEGIQFGDLIRFVNLCETKLGHMTFGVHSAIYIDDAVLWHKPSGYDTSPWTFQNFERTVAEYYALPDYCHLEINFYRPDFRSPHQFY